MDFLWIDTTSRLHNKDDLMAEMTKVIRVIKRLDDSARHHIWLMLEATTGQKALAQAGTFNHMAAIIGLIVTTLDGSAKDRSWWRWLRS